MHIAIVTASMAAGGAERVIAQLLKEWCNNGIDCSLITLQKEPIFYDLPKNINLVEIGKLDNNHYLDKVKKYSSVRKIVKKINPDIVLSLPEEIGIYVIGALLGTGIPIVVSERNNPWLMPYKKESRIMRKLMYPWADGFIFQTQKAASFFSRKIQKKGIVLENPLDISRIPMPYENEREKIIIGAGRLEPQKNFYLLIDAFAEFYKTHLDYKLEIYGEGSLRNDLEFYAEEKLPKEKFAFPGRVTDLPERMNKCSVFVLSSDFEGVPNVLIEAMAMGVPSVATDCAPGGAAELIQDGVNGFIVPVGNAKCLANKMSEIVDNIDIAQSFSAESIKIKKRLDATAVCKAWLNFLIECLNKSL